MLHEGRGGPLSLAAAVGGSGRETGGVAAETASEAKGNERSDLRSASTFRPALFPRGPPGDVALFALQRSGKGNCHTGLSLQRTHKRTHAHTRSSACASEELREMYLENVPREILQKYESVVRFVCNKVSCSPQGQF